MTDQEQAAPWSKEQWAALESVVQLIVKGGFVLLLATLANDQRSIQALKAFLAHLHEGELVDEDGRRIFT